MGLPALRDAMFLSCCNARQENCGDTRTHAHVPADDVHHRFANGNSQILPARSGSAVGGGDKLAGFAGVRLARVRGADHSATICLSPYALECVNFFLGQTPTKGHSH